MCSLQSIYVYDPEVPEPNEQNNNETLLGVDSDQDGIRDDIQRWINFEAEDNFEVRSALKALAKNWQDLIANKDNESIAQDLYLKNQKLTIFLFGVIADDLRASDLATLLKYKVFEDQKRYLILNKIRLLSTGAIQLPLPETQEERLKIFERN